MRRERGLLELSANALPSNAIHRIVRVIEWDTEEGFDHDAAWTLETWDDPAMPMFNVMQCLFNRGFAICRLLPETVWVCSAPKLPPKGY